MYGGTEMAGFGFELRGIMALTVRTGRYGVVKVQAIAARLLFAAGRWVLALPGLNLDFCTDQRHEVPLNALFLMLNPCLARLTLEPGPDWYGHGFAAALPRVVARRCSCSIAGRAGWNTRPSSGNEGHRQPGAVPARQGRRKGAVMYHAQERRPGAFPEPCRGRGGGRRGKYENCLGRG